MKLLNSKSILECDEEEEVLHNDECKIIINSLSNYLNYDCAAIFKYFDMINKNKEPKIRTCNLHDCEDMIEYVDCKNGFDIALIEGYLTFIVYGQTYTVGENDYIIQSAIQIRPYDKNRNFIYLFED